MTRVLREGYLQSLLISSLDFQVQFFSFIDNTTNLRVSKKSDFQNTPQSPVAGTPLNRT